MPEFRPKQDKAGNWRWTLYGDNNEKVATSGEAFDSRSNAVRAAKRVKQLAAEASIVEPPPFDMNTLIRAAADRRRVRLVSPAQKKLRPR